MIDSKCFVRNRNEIKKIYIYIGFCRFDKKMNLDGYL